jgi:hypothetical protein
MISGTPKQIHGQPSNKKVFRNLFKILEILEEFKNHYDTYWSIFRTFSPTCSRILN